jgi:hypothetical protein
MSPVTIYGLPATVQVVLCVISALTWVAARALEDGDATVRQETRPEQSQRLNFDFIG